MNAIQTKARIAFYNDTSRTARFSNQRYENAVMDAVETFISEIIKRGPQAIQENRDSIYTLIKTTAPSTSNGTAIVTRCGSFIPTTFSKPADYHSFMGLRMVIDSVSQYSKPADQNEIFALLDNMHLKPTVKSLSYYVENDTGFIVYRLTGGTVGSANLTYLKTPATFLIGRESQEINEGVGVLTVGQTYIALENDTVQNGITYSEGDSFVAAVTTTLAAGAVILASNTTPLDLPAKTHDTIAKLASGIMMGTVRDYQKSAFVEKEASKS